MPCYIRCLWDYINILLRINFKTKIFLFSPALIVRSLMKALSQRLPVDAWTRQGGYIVAMPEIGQLCFIILRYPIAAPTCFCCSTIHKMLNILTPEFLWRGSLRTIFMPTGFYVLFCVGLVKNNTIFEGERTSWVPSNQGRSRWDIIWWKQRTASVNIFKYECYVVFVYRKPAVQLGQIM
jgi:hypothetical protein